MMGLPLWGLKTFPSPVVWILAFITYLSGLIFSRLITWEDWWFIKRILTQPLAEPGVKPRVES
jgi:hypothetical protein